jgi:hypothetical protein
MPRRYQTKIWRLQLPDAWSVRDGGSQELVIIFRPDGVGMLTVLTADEQQPATIGSDGMFRAPLPDEARESEYGTSYSRTWTLLCRGRKVYVRYTCAAHNAQSERSEIDEIVQSISESDDDVV